MLFTRRSLAKLGSLLLPSEADAANVPWSNTTDFPALGVPAGTEQLVGFKPGSNFKTPIMSPLPFFGHQTQTPWVRPSLAAFSSWINQTDGSANAPTTAVATDNANGLPLVIKAGSDSTTANSAITALMKPIGAPPWTITVAVAGFTLTGGTKGSTANGQFLPLILHDSGGKIEPVYWAPSDGASFFQTYQYPSSALGTAPAASNGALSTIPDYFVWCQVVNDGVNLTYNTGPDGFIFDTFYIEPVASYLGTIDKVGFGIDRVVAAGPTNPIFMLLWHWVQT